MMIVSRLSFFAHFVNLFSWLIAQLIYPFFASLGDQSIYLTSIYTGGGLSTLFASIVYYPFARLVGIFSTLLISTALTQVILLNYKHILSDRYKFVFYLVIFCPHFLIWRNIASKEALFLFFSIPIVLYCAYCLFKKPSNKYTLFVFSLLILGIISRGLYAFPYVYLLITSLLLSPTRPLKGFIKFRFFTISLPRLSAGIYIVLSTLLILAASFIFYSYKTYLSPILLAYMKITRDYFFVFASSTNRYEVLWDQPIHFLSNLPFGIYASNSGFVVSDISNNFLFILPALEGLVYLTLGIFLFYKLIYAITRYFDKSLLFLCIIPAFLLAVTLHYPMGLFNPGSALRYKQNIYPLLVFYPFSVLNYVQIFYRRHRYEKVLNPQFGA